MATTPRRITSSVQEVKTHTTLPPGINGRPFAFLRCSVTLFRWTASHPMFTSRFDGKTPPVGISIHVVWWGEQGFGSVFYPRLAHKAGYKQNTTKMLAKYPVCVPLPQLYAYLSDMKSLFLDVVDETAQLTIGRGRVESLSSLSIEHPITTVLAVADADGAKFGELSVSLSIEPVQVTPRCRPLSIVGSKQVQATGNKADGDAERQTTAPLPPPESSAVLPKPTKRTSLHSGKPRPPSQEVYAEGQTAQQKPQLPDVHIAEREKENVIDPPNGDLSLSPYTTAYQPRQAAGPTESAGLDTVLQKIQSALEQSRRVREQVMQSEMDTEVAAAVANAGFQAAVTATDKSVNFDDFTHVSTDLAASSSSSILRGNIFDGDGDLKQTTGSSKLFQTTALEETICRLGGDGVMPRDLLGVNMDVVSFEDEELDALEGELDLLENGLEDVAPDDSLIADLFYSKRQINTSSSAFYGNVLTPEKCFESLLDDESTTKMEPLRSQAALSESSLPVQRSVGKADQAGSAFDCVFTGVRITFRRCNFPRPIFYAIQSMLSADLEKETLVITTPRQKKPLSGASRAAPRLPSGSSGSAAGRRSSSMPGGQRNGLPPIPLRGRIGERGAAGHPRASRSSSGGGGTFRRSRLARLAPCLATPSEGSESSDDCPETWAVSVEILVPYGLHTDAKAEALLTGEANWFTHTIPLRRAVPRSAAHQNHLQGPSSSSSMPQGLSKQQQPEQQEEILLAPRRTHQSYQAVFLSAEAMDQYISPETVNLKMRLFAGRQSGREENLEDSHEKEEEESTFNRLLGTVDLPCQLLLNCVYQSTEKPQQATAAMATPPRDGSTATPKTLRIRFDFAPPIERRLTEFLLRRDLGSSPNLLRNCNLFVNVEPVWRVKSRGLTTTEAGAKDLLPAPSTEYKVSAEGARRVEQTDSFHRPSVTAQNVQVCAPPFSLHSPKLDTLLTVREARNLASPVSHSYLIIRTPWCSEEGSGDRKAKRFTSAVSWSSGTSPAYHFGLRNSATFNEELMSKLRNSFLPIEVWSKQTDGQPDRLIGLAKIITRPIAQHYFSDDRSVSETARKQALESLLLCERPLVVEDSWVTLVFPLTGQRTGALRVRLAVGTAAQITNLIVADKRAADLPFAEKTNSSSVGWTCLDFIEWPPEASVGGALRGSDDFGTSIGVEHNLDIAIHSLKDFSPRLSETLSREFGDRFPWNDCDCYVKLYSCPDKQGASIISSQTNAHPMRVSPPGSLDTVNCRFTVAETTAADGDQYWHHTVSHRFTARSSDFSEKAKAIHLVDGNAFLNWLGGRTINPADDSGLSLELWFRIFSPRLRDVMVARGTLPWNLLLKLFSEIGPEGQLKRQQRTQQMHKVRLFDVTSNQLTAKLETVLTYGCRPFRTAPDMTPTGPQTSTQGLLSTDTCPLVPSTARTGVRLHVNLLRVSGLWPALIDLPAASFSGHIRLHCLLLMPLPSPGSSCKPPLPRLLSTTSSKCIGSATFCSDLKTQLDTLLPLSWTYPTSSPRSADETTISEPATGVLTLAEALVYAAKAIDSRAEWLGGIVLRPCLVLQVDVWEEPKSRLQTDSWAQPRNATIWGLNYADKTIAELVPEGDHLLVATCRVPLTGLLASGTGTLLPHWHFLIRPRTDAYCGLAGAVELSAQFVAANAQQRVLSEVETCASKWGLRILHEWGAVNTAVGRPGELPEFALGDLGIWDADGDNVADKSKCLSLYIDAACLPSEDVLLGDDEHLMTYRKNGVRGFVFARASFFDLGFQSTPLHALPTGNTRQSSLIQCGDSLHFTAPASPRLRNYLCKSSLDVQIWAQWMYTGGGKEENSNFSCHAATTDLASSCKYGHPFLRPPPPRLLGSIQIPLLHLLYGRSKEGLFKAFPSTDSVVLHGTPDSFFLLPQTASAMQRRASAQLVYPLFKPDSEDFREAWVAVRLELVNQRKSGVQPADAYTKAAKIPSDAWPGILSWTFSGALPDTERHAFPLASERQWKQSERVGNASNAVTSSSSIFETFPAHILVERAGHLVPDELLKGHPVDELPKLETFVTFMVSAGGTTLSEVTAGKPNIDPSQSGRIAVTHLVKDAISPVWDYQRYGCLPLSLLSDSSGGLAFDVWQKPRPAAEGSSCPDRTSASSTRPRFLGSANVDLTSLVLPGARGRATRGLQFVHGWYNLLDREGRQRGQILVGVYPLGDNPSESATALPGGDRLPLSRTDSSSLGQTSWPPPLVTSPDLSSPLQRMRKLLDANPLQTADPPADTSGGEKTQPKICLWPCTSPNLTLSEQTNLSFLRDTLQNQLGELDALNAKLKSRLNRSSGGAEIPEPASRAQTQPIPSQAHPDASQTHPAANETREPELHKRTNLPSANLGSKELRDSEHSPRVQKPPVVTLEHHQQPRQEERPPQGKREGKGAPAAVLDPSGAPIQPAAAKQQQGNARASILKEAPLAQHRPETAKPGHEVGVQPRRSLRVIDPSPAGSGQWKSGLLNSCMGDRRSAEEEEEEELRAEVIKKNQRVRPRRNSRNTSRSLSPPSSTTYWRSSRSDSAVLRSNNAASPETHDLESRRRWNSDVGGGAVCTLTANQNRSTTLQDAPSLPSHAATAAFLGDNEVSAEPESERMSETWSEVSITVPVECRSAGVQFPSFETDHRSSVQACESDRPTAQAKSPAVVSPSDSISIFSSSSSSSPGPSVHLPVESVEVQGQNSGSHCQQSVETEGEVSTTSSTYFYLRVRNLRKEEAEEEQTANQRPVVSSSISTDISGVARPPEEEAAEETGDEREVVPDETATEVATELHLSPVTLDRAEVTVTTRKSPTGQNAPTVAGDEDRAPAFFPSVSEMLASAAATRNLGASESLWSLCEPAGGGLCQANEALPHRELRALRLARQAAETVKATEHETTAAMARRTRPAAVEEDPIRDRIRRNLSALVQNATSSAGSGTQPTPSSTDDTPTQPPAKLNARALQRAAKIFDLKL